MYVCELHDPIAHRLSGHLVPLGAVMLPPRAPRPLLVSGRREAARVPLQREKRTKLVPGWREDEGASEAKCSVSENETQAWRVRAGSGRAGGGRASHTAFTNDFLRKRILPSKKKEMQL